MQVVTKAKQHPWLATALATPPADAARVNKMPTAAKELASSPDLPVPEMGDPIGIAR